MRVYDLLIIGGGASGLMAAYRYKDINIAIVEANHKIGAKIEISGGGKCNITNRHISAERYYGDKEFIKPILLKLSPDELLSFFRDRGVEFVKRKKSQYFTKNGSIEIIRVFREKLKGTDIYLSTKVDEIKKSGDTFTIKTQKGDFKAKRVIVATGGLSYPKIGASDLAYRVAKEFGHTISPLKPALVGLTLQKEQFFFKELSGVSIDAKVKVKDRVFRDNILFAHRGITGPAILNASLYWQKGEIEIDFLPNISKDKLLKLSKSSIPLPKRFLKLFLERYDREELKSYSFAPAGDFGYSRAEVTKGGIITDEIDPNSMESRVVKDLYFLGEALDVTGELGGYNFHFTFATAQALKIKD